MDTITKTAIVDFSALGIKSPVAGFQKKETVSRCKTCKCEVENGAVQCLKCLYGE